MYGELCVFFFFQAEDGIRDLVRSRGLGDVYKRQKQGSKHMRWILVQVARAASKVKGSRLERFFLRIKARRGSNVATIALARKILCILYHLLINQEMYEEATIKKSKPSKNGIMKSSLPREMNLEDMIEVIRQSGYSVDRVDRGSHG